MTVSEPSEVIQPSIPDCGQSSEQAAPVLSDAAGWHERLLAKIAAGDWIHPVDVMADGLVDVDERVLAKLRNGDEVHLTYGCLSDAEDSSDHWLGFYNDDGEEVLNDEIEGIKLRPAVADTCRDVPENVGLVSGVSSGPFSSTRKDERA